MITKFFKNLRRRYVSQTHVFKLDHYPNCLYPGMEDLRTNQVFEISSSIQLALGTYFTYILGPTSKSRPMTSLYLITSSKKVAAKDLYNIDVVYSHITENNKFICYTALVNTEKGIKKLLIHFCVKFLNKYFPYGHPLQFYCKIQDIDG